MYRFIATALVLLVIGSRSFASETNQADFDDTTQKVWNNLVPHLFEVPGYDYETFRSTCWAPQLMIVDSMDLGSGKTRMNACACHLSIKLFGRYVPIVMITRDYVKAHEGDPDALALILGHELGHHILGHTRRGGMALPGLQANAEGHRREADADLFGAKIVLKTPQYSLRKAIQQCWVSDQRMGDSYSAVAGVCFDHPGWTDRMARLKARLDRGDAELWSCMTIFENGTSFLTMNNYLVAEYCFEKVLREFPNCYEAWANLGLARLLRYCDGLSAEDIQEMGIGHFLGTLAYPTARSLVTRGRTAELWDKALFALKKANELKPGSPIIMANLGLAYLVHPTDKEGMRKEARNCFEQALKAIGQLREFPLQVRLSMEINLGVAAIAVGNKVEGQKCLVRAKDQIENWLNYIARERAEAAKQGQKFSHSYEPWLLEMNAAVAYNIALLVSEANPKDALRSLEAYLDAAPQTDLWWNIGYEEYERLASEVGATARPKTTLGKKAARRKQLAITLKSGEFVYVGQNVTELERLGTPSRVTPLGGSTAFRRMEFQSHGFYVVADEDEIFLIVITAKDGPAVVLQEPGPGGKVLGEFRIGMTRKEVLALPGGLTAEKRAAFGKLRPGTQEVEFAFYDYYPDLAVALAFSGDSEIATVTGILIGEMTPFK